MKFRNIYVAATSQHVGKTTSTLGIASGFKKAGYHTGYCKPVGQKHLTVNGDMVDKDSVLFADLLKFDIDRKVHSPIILPRGATSDFLEHPENYDLDKLLRNAQRDLESIYDITIYEGTGHPGVGSVANVSNAYVAKLLNAGVVMIVEGGVGNTIDKLNLSLSLFREHDVPILGVIINKVISEKLDMVEYFVSKWLKKNNLPLLGLVPYDDTLAYPLFWTVAKNIQGEIEFNEERGFNKVEKILAGSLVDIHELNKSKNILLVVSSRMLKEAIDKIATISAAQNFDDTPLSGIVVTGENTISDSCQTYIMENKIPTVRTNLDTYAAVIKISQIEVKINRRTPWKIAKAIQLINQNVNLDMLINTVKL